MLPFPVINKYDNKAWYDGADLMAFDSKLLKNILGSSGTINDYTGQRIESGRWNGSQYCTLGPESGSFEYGKGIKIPVYCYLYNRTIDPAFLLSSWTLDMWTYQNPINTQWNMQTNALVVSGTPQALSSGNRFLFSSYYNDTTLKSNVGIWNNVGPAGSYFIPTQYNTLWCKTSWVHFAIQYDSTNNTFYLFENGVMKYSFQYQILNVNISTRYIGINNAGSPGNPYIERYRLRTGNHFSTSGFNVADIYN